MCMIAIKCMHWGLASHFQRNTTKLIFNLLRACTCGVYQHTLYLHICFHVPIMALQAHKECLRSLTACNYAHESYRRMHKQAAT